MGGSAGGDSGKHIGRWAKTEEVLDQALGEGGATAGEGLDVVLWAGQRLYLRGFCKRRAA